MKSAGLASLFSRNVLHYTAIARAIQAGVDLLTIKKISGYKSLGMLKYFDHQNG
jgi:hypothetical protein